MSGDTTATAEVRQRSVTSRGWWTRIDPALLLIAALPWAVLRLDSSWLFGYATSPLGLIDPWVYFGFFLDLIPHIRAFKGAYFTTRLTWTVPGAIVYHFFSPVVDTYVLHLILFYASTIALYLILKMTVSRRAAVVAVLLMAFHSYFLWSVGWPYMDGAANTYLLWTLCVLTFASRAAHPKRWLIAAGALAAMAIYCQFFLIVFAPVVLGYAHFSRRTAGIQWERPWRAFGWGFAAVTVIFGVFNMAVNGRFLFFINSVGTAAKLVINHNPYKAPNHAWLMDATWLVVPTIALVGAVLCLRSSQSQQSAPNVEFLLFWQRYFVLSFATMLFWQIVGQPVLQLVHYTSYLIPPAFLALGSQIAIVTQRWTRVLFLLLCAGIGVILLIPFALPLQSSFVMASQRHALLLSLGTGLLGVVILNRQIRFVSVAGVLVLLVSLASLNATSGPHTWAHGGSLDDPTFQKPALLSIVDSVRVVQDLDPRGNVFFWYDGESRLGHLFRAVASTYLWSYRLQSEEFPRLGPRLPPVGQRILILAEDGESALREAEASLNREGLGAELLTRRQIHQVPFLWDMMEIQVTAQASCSAGILPANAGEMPSGPAPGQKAISELSALSFRRRTRRRNPSYHQCWLTSQIRRGRTGFDFSPNPCHDVDSIAS